MLHDVYAGCQQLGMCRAFAAGFCIVDIDRVDADENDTRLDQVRRGIGAEVRRARGISRGAEVPIPAGM